MPFRLLLLLLCCWATAMSAQDLPGFYPIRIEYFQREHGLELMYQYLPPDSE